MSEEYRKTCGRASELSSDQAFKSEEYKKTGGTATERSKAVQSTFDRKYHVQ